MKIAKELYEKNDGNNFGDELSMSTKPELYIKIKASHVNENERNAINRLLEKIIDEIHNKNLDMFDAVNIKVNVKLLENEYSNFLKKGSIFSFIKRNGEKIPNEQNLNIKDDIEKYCGDEVC